MDRCGYDGVVDAWKVELIVARARRMGFRRDEINDAQQGMILDVVAFRFDAAKSNGAKESTVLQALIDNQLKKMCRTTARYRARLERLKEEPLPESACPDQARGLDIQAAVASLSEPERAVCRALGEGCSKEEIARRLDCGWHKVDRLVRRIREHFEELGLDAYLAA